MSAAPDRARRGALCEDRALRELGRAGLQLLARNVRYRFGEIDLVMRERDMLVFVEVRLRSARGFGDAGDSVDAHKQRRLIRAASAYLAANPGLAALPCRFDVVGFVDAQDNSPMEWIKDAFRLD